MVRYRGSIQQRAHQLRRQAAGGAELSFVQRLLLILLLAWIALSGMACVAIPDRVIAFRRSRGWGNGLWSGGWFYATPARTRIMGAIVTLVALVGGILAAKVGRL